MDLGLWNKDSKGSDPPVRDDDWSPEWWFLMFRCRVLSNGYSKFKANLALDKKFDPDLDVSLLPSPKVLKAYAEAHATKIKNRKPKLNPKEDSPGDGNESEDSADAKLSVKEEADRIFKSDVEKAERDKAIQALLVERRTSHNKSLGPKGVALDVNTGSHVTGNSF